MIITAISDIHAHYGAVESIVGHERNSDVVVIAGDISTYGTAAEVSAALKAILAHGSKVLAVAGNMDSPDSETELDRLGISLNARGVRVGDVGFYGVSAAPPSHLRTPYEITEHEIERRLQTGYDMVKDSPITVCVPHSPPMDTSLDRISAGKHVGSKAIRKFIEKHRPDVVVCGHIHEARGQDALGKTRMVNCGAANRGYYARITISNKITVENLEITLR